MTASRVQTFNSQLSGGRYGNIETLCVMRRLARLRSTHPDIRACALEIVKDVPGHAHLLEAVKLGEFVRDNVRYRKDIHAVEQLHDPLTLLDQIDRGEAVGDCDDKSLLLCSLLLSIGIAPQLRLVRYSRGSGHYDHVYVVVRERNGMGAPQRVVLDTILEDKPIGWELPHASGSEFGV